MSADMPLQSVLMRPQTCLEWRIGELSLIEAVDIKADVSGGSGADGHGGFGFPVPVQLKQLYAIALALASVLKHASTRRGSSLCLPHVPMYPRCLSLKGSRFPRSISLPFIFLKDKLVLSPPIHKFDLTA
jgi:hypothetical protein